MNSASSLQLGTFLFGGAKNTKTKESTEEVRVFKVAREEIPEDALEAYKKRDEEMIGTKKSKSANVRLRVKNLKRISQYQLLFRRGIGWRRS
jgi:hypothetical protein